MVRVKIWLLLMPLLFYYNVTENHSIIKIHEMEYKYVSIVERKNISIKYPTISSNIYNDDQLNTIIYEHVINRYRQLKNVAVDIKYDITRLDSKLISIVFRGDSYISNMAYPSNICFAITINLNNANIQTLRDYIINVEKIENLLQNNQYVVETGGLKACSPDELYETMRWIYKDDTQNHIEDFYLNNDHTINIIVPLPHSAGDYSIIKLLETGKKK